MTRQDLSQGAGAEDDACSSVDLDPSDVEPVRILHPEHAHDHVLGAKGVESGFRFAAVVRLVRERVVDGEASRTVVVHEPSTRVSEMCDPDVRGQNERHRSGRT